MSKNQDSKPDNTRLYKMLTLFAVVVVLAGLLAIVWGEAEAKYEARQGNQTVIKRMHCQAQLHYQR